MATIEDLSPEILVEIFSHYVRSEGQMTFLRNIPRVCKHWNELSSDSSLWRDVRADNSDYLVNISRRGLLYYTQSLECHRYGENFSYLNLSAVLKKIRNLKALYLKGKAVDSDVIKLVSKHSPHLERLCLAITEHCDMTPHDWDQFLDVLGPTLKDLDLRYYNQKKSWQPHLLSGIAARCPLLERFVLFLDSSPVPIHEFLKGCPRLRELEFYSCYLTTAGRNDSLGSGFKDLKKFIAVKSDFSGLDVDSLFKDSMDLEYLKLSSNYKALEHILNIPSDKVRILKIETYKQEKYLKVLGDIVYKWRRTLTDLELIGRAVYIDSVLEHLLHDNPNPPLKSLSISLHSYHIPHQFFKEFVQKCQNLIYLQINWEMIYEGRQEIEKRFGISHEKRDH